MIELTREPIDVAAVTDPVLSPDGRTAYVDVAYTLDKLTAVQLDDAQAKIDLDTFRVLPAEPDTAAFIVDFVNAAAFGPGPIGATTPFAAWC